MRCVLVTLRIALVDTNIGRTESLLTPSSVRPDRDCEGDTLTGQLRHLAQHQRQTHLLIAGHHHVLVGRIEISPFECRYKRRPLVHAYDQPVNKCGQQRDVGVVQGRLSFHLCIVERSSVGLLIERPRNQEHDVRVDTGQRLSPLLAALSHLGGDLHKRLWFGLATCLVASVGVHPIGEGMLPDACTRSPVTFQIQQHPLESALPNNSRRQTRVGTIGLPVVVVEPVWRLATGNPNGRVCPEEVVRQSAPVLDRLEGVNLRLQLVVGRPRDLPPALVFQEKHNAVNALVLSGRDLFLQECGLLIGVFDLDQVL